MDKSPSSLTKLFTLLTGLMVCAMGFCGGCQSDIRPITITVESAGVDRSTEVDLIGLTADNRGLTERIDATKWFGSGQGEQQTERRNLNSSGFIATGRIPARSRTPWVIRQDHPIWKTWADHKVERVLVVIEPPAGTTNPRLWRKELDVMDKKWVDDQARVGFGNDGATEPVQRR